MTGNSGAESRAVMLHIALANTPCLRWHSAERDALWLAVQGAVCTRGHISAQPMGSTAEQEVGGEDARQDELLAAMSWLMGHEHDARALAPGELFRRLRGVAVRGKHGSARSAQADALHGMTGVTGGCTVRFSREAVA